MTALAAQADVETVLGRTLTTAEEAKLDGALAAASRSVRRVTGRRYEAGTFTVRRRVFGCNVVLDSPSSVGAVNAVGFDGALIVQTGWTLRDDVVYGIRGHRWVDVTYTVDDPAEVPAEVVGVCASMAARLLEQAIPEGATSYSLTRGPFTQAATFAGPHSILDPTASEAATLAGYALRRNGPLTIGPQ